MSKIIWRLTVTIMITSMFLLQALAFSTMADAGMLNVEEIMPVFDMLSSIVALLLFFATYPLVCEIAAVADSYTEGGISQWYVQVVYSVLFAGGIVYAVTIGANAPVSSPSRNVAFLIAFCVVIWGLGDKFNLLVNRVSEVVS